MLCLEHICLKFYLKCKKNVNIGNPIYWIFILRHFNRRNILNHVMWSIRIHSTRSLWFGPHASLPDPGPIEESIVACLTSSALRDYSKYPASPMVQRKRFGSWALLPRLTGGLQLLFFHFTLQLTGSSASLQAPNSPALSFLTPAPPFKQGESGFDKLYYLHLCPDWL